MIAIPAVACGTKTDASPSPLPLTNPLNSDVRSAKVRRDISSDRSSVSIPECLHGRSDQRQDVLYLGWVLATPLPLLRWGNNVHWLGTRGGRLCVHGTLVGKLEETHEATHLFFGVRYQILVANALPTLARDAG